MKQGLLFLWLALSPVAVFAGVQPHDSCMENGKYKSEYTLDRRCYVTDEQKQQAPYNAVVKLNEGGTCTGTIVKKGDEYFMYTAKHCFFYTDVDSDSNYVDIASIELQDGRTLSANRLMGGDRFAQFDDGTYYKIMVDKDAVGIPYVQTDSFKDGKVQIVGYGMLSIMSDKEIRRVKNGYVDYLKKYDEFVGKNDDGTIAISEQNGFTKDGGMRGLDFKSFFYNWMNEYLGDGNLKISDCELSNKILKGCQVWGGNSGGPLFNNQGKLMGIVSSGNYQIGGSKHASVGLVVGVHFNEKDVYKQQDWVASSQSQSDYTNWYTSIQQQNEQQEREAYNIEVSNAQMSKQIQQQARMQLQDIRLQNQQMMMNMNKQYW